MEDRTRKHPLGCWHLLRWFVASIIMIIFIAWVTIGLPLAAVSRTLVDRGHLKYWLVASGIYAEPVTLISDIIIHTNPADSPLLPVVQQAKDSNSAVGQAMTTVIYPTLVQHSVHTIINATYDWLEGKSERPTFSIALLPDETAAHVNAIANVDEVIQQTTISSDQLPITSRTTANAQQLFRLVVLLPGIVVAGSVISIALLLIIIPNRRRSFMVVGTMLLGLGGLLAITELVLASNFQSSVQLLFSWLLPPQANWIVTTFVVPLQLAYNDMLIRAARYSFALASVGGIILLCAVITQLFVRAWVQTKHQSPHRPHFTPKPATTVRIPVKLRSQ